METNQVYAGRYARQIMLPEIGPDGQRKLSRGSVLIVGLGGLGSPAALYLAAAGIGRLGLMDFDVVEDSNLNRQILHDSSDLNRLKAKSAAEALALLNPEVDLEVIPDRATPENLPGIVDRFDFILDGMDNFSGKYLLSDACARAGKPFSHAGISGFQGQTFTWLPGKGNGCYRCLFPAPPPAGKLPDHPQGGVLGSVPGVIGCIQASEAVKFFIGAGELLTNRLLVYDALKQNFRGIRFAPRPGCLACGGGEKSI